MSSLKGKRGWLLGVNSTSTPIKCVFNDSLYNGQSLSTNFNDGFVSLTSDFINGHDGGLKFHVSKIS